MSSGVPVMNINRVVVDAPRRLPGGPWLDFVRRLCCPYSTHCVPHHKTRSSTRYLAPIVNCPSGGRRRRRRIEAEPRSLGEGWTSTEGDAPAVHHLCISPLRRCHGLIQACVCVRLSFSLCQRINTRAFTGNRLAFSSQLWRQVL